MGDEAVSHTVVICAENHREILEFQHDLIELILDFRLLVNDSLNSLGYASAGYLLYRLHATEIHTLDSCHGNVCPVKEKVLTVGQAVADSVSRFDRNHKVSVRRLQFIVFWRSCSAHCH